MRSYFSMAIALLLLLSAGAGAQEKMAKVGWLTWYESGASEEVTHAAFARGLREGGYEHGKNLTLLRRSAQGDYRRFAALSRELGAQKVDVFFAPVTAMAREAWKIGDTPIVIALIADPVANRFVKSLSRPGTRVTGVAPLSNELNGKRLQLLAELVPGLKRVGVLMDDYVLDSCGQEYGLIEANGRRLNLEIIRVAVHGRDELEAAFQRMRAENVQAVLATLVTTRHETERDSVALAAKYRLPMAHHLEENVRSGGLFSYGPDYAEIHRRAGHYVARILKGEKPPQMAMEQPREFRLIVNLKTARALGLTVPQSILVRADEVIQ